MTNPGTHDSEIYQKLLKGAEESGQLKIDPRRRVPPPSNVAGAGGGNSSSSSSSTSGGSVSRRGGEVREEPSEGGGYAPVSWVDQGDFEWGYCRRTKVRKAPRAHYDHITKKLVLNMDHYCSWLYELSVFCQFLNLCLIDMFLWDLDHCKSIHCFCEKTAGKWDSVSLW